MINKFYMFNISLYQRIFLYGLAAFVVMITTASFILMAEAGSTKPTVYSVQSSPYGLPFSEWAIKWWQWHISIPKGEHPRANPTSTHCPVGDGGSVSFVTQSIQGYSELVCTIPAEKSVLFLYRVENAILMKLRVAMKPHYANVLAREMSTQPFK
jgi:hypothetical protein